MSKTILFIQRHAQATCDAKGDGGRWITTEQGNHVHLDEKGNPDKGNPHVIKAMKKGGAKSSKESDRPKKKAEPKKGAAKASGNAQGAGESAESLKAKRLELAKKLREVSDKIHAAGGWKKAPKELREKWKATNKEYNAARNAHEKAEEEQRASSGQYKKGTHLRLNQVMKQLKNGGAIQLEGDHGSHGVIRLKDGKVEWSPNGDGNWRPAKADLEYYKKHFMHIAH